MLLDTLRGSARKPLRPDQYGIVEKGVESEVRFEAFEGLGRAPGFAEEPVYTVAKHGGGVIEAEDGVPDELFELALSYDTAPTSFGREVLASGKVAFQISGISRVFIGLKERFRDGERF
jgi:hypothetical protein